ncbi:MAG: hypothetical protein Kow0099_08280 [Candidatus Abyssubacteria bacterium]
MFEYYLPVLLLAGFTLVLNLPFGFLRARASKYSLRWFLYIHLPIPFVYLARTCLMVAAHFIPFLVCAAIVGQIWGGRIGGAPK